ncbi:MAG TPA: hypothetical protein VK009_15585 [Chloroflexota bacterium]|nr:hypothetical protein [Chloroflexota bacterium]
MAGVDGKRAYTLHEELTDLRVALERKRSEISNLKVGYIRSVESGGPIPPEPLRRNLISARAELLDLEQRVAAIESELS